MSTVVTLSAMLAEYMQLSAESSETIILLELFGSRLYLSPMGAGALLTGLVAGEIYLVFRIDRAGGVAESLVLFSFAALSGILALFFTKSFVDAYFPQSGVFVILFVGGGIFLSMFLTFLILIGEYSEGVKNLLLLIFGSTISAFFSLILPTVSLAAILAVVMALDLLLTYVRAKDVEQREPAKLSFTTRDWGIGLGDLIVFGMVTSKALLILGPLAYLASLTLLMLGLGLGMKVARVGKLHQLPGTLVAAGPASIPILLMLTWRAGTV